MDRINVVQDRMQWMALVNMVMNPRVPWNVGKFLSRRAQLHIVSNVIYPLDVTRNSSIVSVMLCGERYRCAIPLPH
jgi:hypothetical protein